MLTSDKHWERMERNRDKDGCLPRHAFDFISVHHTEGQANPYSLVSPLCLVKENGRRPAWEACRFHRKATAVAFAHIVAATKPGLFVVDCTRPGRPAVRWAEEK